MTISAFNSDREVSRDCVQPGRYRMAFSLDGGTNYQVRNVICELDASGRRRVRWCDEVWQAYPPTNSADVGLLVDDMDELVRFEAVPSLPELLGASSRSSRFCVPVPVSHVAEINQRLLESKVLDGDANDVGGGGLVCE